MPRSIWKGSIAFGLVHIPVGLYSAGNAGVCLWALSAGEVGAAPGSLAAFVAVFWGVRLVLQLFVFE